MLRKTSMACPQAVGEHLHGQGWRGLIAPSAARRTSLVLPIFLRDAGILEHVVPAGSTLATDAPVPRRACAHDR